MDTKKSLIAGSLLAGSLIVSPRVWAEKNADLGFTDIGTGGELRNNLLDGDSRYFSKTAIDLKYGKGSKCGR